jgi:hypothetical protein
MTAVGFVLSRVDGELPGDSCYVLRTASDSSWKGEPIVQPRYARALRSNAE